LQRIKMQNTDVMSNVNVQTSFAWNPFRPMKYLLPQHFKL